MKEILLFLTVGAFVYLGLGLQGRCGDLTYSLCVITALLIGYFIR